MVGWRAVVRLLLTLALMVGLLFGSAGTFRWPMAWAYVVLALGGTAISRVLLLRLQPDLAAERAASLDHKDAKAWDRVLMPIMAIVGPLLLLALTGLDHRFGWSPPLPLWLMIAAGVVLLLAYLLGNWAMFSNRFFSGTVRIQHDRGHTVVTTGPYRLVRHPAYASNVLAWAVTPVMLGSLWALIPGAALIVLTVIRTALEDRTLLEELPGYRLYAERTRWRLLPGIW
ncbi:MAG: isoprenylcysteine carboxylmethyltransferase family protein [Anaerolineae bacterium]